MSVANKTLAMKTRVYNQIRITLYKRNIDSFTLEEKQRLFDKIFGLNAETHWELNAYKQKRRDVKELYNARVARGYNFKKKTKKEDYLLTKS
jgi:hypothetical protein